MGGGGPGDPRHLRNVIFCIRSFDHYNPRGGGGAKGLNGLPTKKSYYDYLVLKCDGVTIWDERNKPLTGQNRRES